MKGSLLQSAERLIHVTQMGGHHGSYCQLFGGLLGLEVSLGRIGKDEFRRLVAAQELFFATLDDDVRGFVVVALTRATLGRKTAAIFMRPQSSFFSG